MPRNLIIKGEQGSGKTLLADFFNSKTDMFVYDGSSKTEILEFAEASKTKVFKVERCFITNEDVNYSDVPEGMFLIIELKKFV